MAQYEADREDLMAEAVALEPRAALRLLPDETEVIAGFRRGTGWLSLYFGPDPVYHFTAAGELRRAYVGGALYRTQGNSLARLTRERDVFATTLQRVDLTPMQWAEFRENVLQAVRRLLEHLERGDFAVSQQIPADHDFLPELTARLQQILATGCPLAPALKR